eukprot:Gb_16739 [translate_table: standard]
MKNGQVKNITYVRYVLGLKRNLLSVGQMMYQNYKVEFDEGHCFMKDKLNNYAVVAKGEVTEDGLFKFTTPVNEAQALQATINLDGRLWHQRFGHMNS